MVKQAVDFFAPPRIDPGPNVTVTVSRDEDSAVLVMGPNEIPETFCEAKTPGGRPCWLGLDTLTIYARKER